MHDKLVWRDYTVQFTESMDSLDFTGPRIRWDSAVKRGDDQEDIWDFFRPRGRRGLNRFNRTEGI
jgi:hypothetical protein